MLDRVFGLLQALLLQPYILTSSNGFALQ